MTVLFCRFYCFSLPIASQIYLTEGTRQENMGRPAHIHCPGKQTQRIGYLFHPCISWGCACKWQRCTMPYCEGYQEAKYVLFDLKKFHYSQKRTQPHLEVSYNLKARYKQVQMNKVQTESGTVPAGSNLMFISCRKR